MSSRKGYVPPPSAPPVMPFVLRPAMDALFKGPALVLDTQPGKRRAKKKGKQARKRTNQSRRKNRR